jgi:hypothetical protein
LSALRLADVVEHRAGAVGQDHVDIVRREPAICIAPESARAAPVAVRVGRGDVEGVTGELAAQHFGVKFGAARAGVFLRFQNHGRSAFARHKAIAIHGERAAGVFSGSSVRLESGPMRPKAAMVNIDKVDSAPPAMITSASPRWRK